MRKIGIIIFILIFGISCFIGGFLYSNFLVKRNQSIGEAKKIEYERKFIIVSSKIAQDKVLSLEILSDISSVWSNAINNNYDFNLKIEQYLLKNENVFEAMTKDNENIERGMQDLKDYPLQYQEAYNSLMELFSVYSQIYSLAQSPSGTLVSYNSKIADLSSEFTKIFSRLKIYIPKLKEENTKQEKKEKEEHLPTPTDFLSIDVAPKPLKWVKPFYPNSAKKAGLEGKVWVQALVDKYGKVKDAKCIKEGSVNPDIFCESAILAAKQCEYSPALSNKKPVASWVQYEVEFSLK